MSKYFVTVDMEIDAENSEEIERMIDRFSEEGFEVLNVVTENIDEDYEEDF
jgi:magnesium-transporting ATPase (P-type)